MMAQTTGRDSARSEAARLPTWRRTRSRHGRAVADGIAATTEAVTGRTERTLDAAEEHGREGAQARWSGWCSTGPHRRCTTWSKAESDLARFWLEMTRDQAQHTIETMQRLAAVRDWREALELQSEYLRESMARMAEGICGS